MVDTSVFADYYFLYLRKPERHERARAVLDRLSSLGLSVYEPFLFEVELIADDILLREYEKWFRILSTRIPRIRGQAELLYTLIQAKVRVEIPDKKYINRVKPYIPETEAADTYHAATCLRTDSVLITNDEDFQELARHGVIGVWTITEAIRRILK